MNEDHIINDPADRPGIQSTEFWLAFAVALGGGLAAAFSDREWAQVAGIIASAIASVGYGASRAKVKTLG